MKPNILLLISVIFSLSTLKGNTQVLNTGFGESGIYLMATKNLSKSQMELRYGEIEGSPYLFEDFRKCDLNLKNGSEYKGIAVRLNIYDNNFEFQRGDTYYIFDKVDAIKLLKFMDGSKITFVENKNKEIEGFYKIEAGEKYRLLTSLDVSFREGKSATNSYAEDISPQFIRIKDKQYIQRPDGSLIYLKNKKSFSKAFATSHKEFVNYAKTNKLNPGNQEDLIKIIDYMNTSSK